MIAFTGFVDGGFFAWLSGAASAFALWAAGQRARPKLSEMEALILREQHPWQYAARFPLKAIERLFR